ncbi:MAG: M23 family metallopeptidase [Prevotellaceae bacterium]|nr:M23 family metallopeptidase [Prevotellaceae bacterium]
MKLRVLKAKKRYIFNPETLSHEQEIVSFSSRIKRSALVFLGMSLMAAAWILVYSSFFNTPKGVQLLKENQDLIAEYEILSMKMGEAARTLNQIMERDNKVYRAVFGEDIISPSIRDAGFIGTDRYAKYKDADIQNVELLTNTYKQMDVLMKKAYIQSKSFDKIAELASNKTQMLKSMPIAAPLDLSKIKFSSGFGYRIDPVFGFSRFHYGVDLAGKVGLPIYASGDGKVVQAMYSGSYGYFVEIDHGFGYSTYYAHLSEISVIEGQKVKRGAKVGELGSTGKSVGPHLHYEVRLRNIPQNPLNYFENTFDENPKDVIFIDQGDYFYENQ